MDDLLPLGVYWLAYCTLHSALAAPACKRVVTRRWPRYAAAYRLGYNLLALLLLAPVAAWHLTHRGVPLWSWSGGLAYLSGALTLAAIAAFAHSLRYYDGAEFLGLAQWAAGARETPGGERFLLSPYHRHVRHPWYSLGLILIWTRDMDAAMLVSAILISVYLVVGSRIEEAKLLARYGEAYRRYRERVPALLPLPGRSLDAAEARALVALAARPCAPTDSRIESEPSIR